MKQAMIVAVIIAALFWICGGLAGLLWGYVFAIPIGVVLFVIGAVLGWFNE